MNRIFILWIIIIVSSNVIGTNGFGQVGEEKTDIDFESNNPETWPTEPTPEQSSHIADQINTNPERMGDFLSKVTDPDQQRKVYTSLNQQRQNEFLGRTQQLYNFKDEFRDFSRREYGSEVEIEEGDKYDSENGILTTKDGSDIDLNTMNAKNVKSIEDGVNVDGSQYKKATNIHGNPDGSTTADKAEFVQSNTAAVWGGESITIFPDGSLFIDSAEIIQKGTTFAYDVHKYNESGTIFHVKSAENVSSDDCLYFWNVTNTTFIITPNHGQAISEDNINITDCDGIDSSFYPIDEGAIDVEKFDARYNIANATIKIEDETLVTNNSAIVNIKDTGIICVTIDPPGTYYQTFTDIRKDFALHIYQNPYYFCIRKEINETFPIPVRNNRGLLDFIEKSFYLNGQVQYLRYPFAQTLTSADFENIYDGIYPNSKSIINLDNQMLYINMTARESISNPAEYITILEEGNTSWVNLIHKKILSYNTAGVYNLATITGNIFVDKHEIYPYNEQFIQSYILALQ